MSCVEALAVGFKRVKLKRVMDAQAMRFIGFALARIAILYIRFRRRVPNWAMGARVVGRAPARGGGCAGSGCMAVRRLALAQRCVSDP